MDVLHYSEVVPYRGNSTTSRIPMRKPVIGRQKAPVPKSKETINFLISIGIFFCLCILSLQQKGNSLFCIAQTLASSTPS
jgi:hypothetical protein